MGFSLLPKNDKFFELFQESSRTLHLASVALVDLMENYTDVPTKVAEIKRLEEVGDGIIHRTMTSLHQSFITPIDREDIAALGERMDDVLDCIEEAARYMVEYGIKEPTENARELARIILRSSEVLQIMMNLLQNSKRNVSQLLTYKDELNTLENQADQVTSRAIGDLFENHEVIDIIKWKEVYSQLEAATDRCEEIAAIVEGIVIKHA